MDGTQALWLFVGELFAVSVIWWSLRRLHRSRRAAIKRLDDALIDMMTPKLLYPKGTIMMCQKSHVIGTAKRDIMSTGTMSTKDFDFMPTNKMHPGEPTTCKLCHAETVVLTKEGWRLINPIIPKEKNYETGIE